MPVTQQNLLRGKDIYLRRCAGCHGAKGDGKGPAAEFLAPKPFDFTSDDGNVRLHSATVWEHPEQLEAWRESEWSAEAILTGLSHLAYDVEENTYEDFS